MRARHGVRRLLVSAGCAALAGTLVGTALCGPAAAIGGPAEDPARGRAACTEVRLPVRLAPGTPATQTIAGTLCRPSRPTGTGRQVDVLVHGGTYNRGYWDFPTRYPKYSHVRRVLRSGRAAFAYDRLGTGTSGRPISTAVTVDAEAYVLHQVIGWLRGGQRLTRVNVVGHSFGSVIAVREAALYGGADRLVLTGYLNAFGPAAARVDALYPAAQDPRFAGGGYDPGYVTSVPGTRRELFFSASAEPAVVAADEATKDVASMTFFLDGIAQLGAPAASSQANRVRVPVLLVNGAEDRIFCGATVDCSDAAAVARFERRYFTSARRLDVRVIARTGHDLALHPSAAESYAVIDRWLTGHR